MKAKIRWYLRGMPLAGRLMWAAVAGTDDQFEQVVRDIDTYHATDPR